MFPDQTETHIYIHAKPGTFEAWKRTLDQIRSPEAALAAYEGRPYDQEEEPA